jgi:hypothetical protein
MVATLFDAIHRPGQQAALAGWINLNPDLQIVFSSVCFHKTSMSVFSCK